MLSQLSFFSNKKRKEISESLSKYKVNAIKEFLSSNNGNNLSSTIKDKKSPSSSSNGDKRLNDDQVKNNCKTIDQEIVDTLKQTTIKEVIPNNIANTCTNQPDPIKLTNPMTKLSFPCQLAQGSATKTIKAFSNVKQLYENISTAFNIPINNILFCTLNTHRVDMDALLSGHIGLQDFIYVHLKGQSKEIEITKNEQLLGLTITDNGNGYSFIKKIKEKSLIEAIKFVSVGDVIEKVDGQNHIGSRHFEVAKALKNIPIGTTFTIRLIEPCRGAFNFSPRDECNKNSKKGFGNGRETLRLRSNGPAIVEDYDDNCVMNKVMEKINVLLESFMGIFDNELATQIWEIGRLSQNPHDFVVAIESSDLEIFKFNDDLLFDIWGVISDCKFGRIVNEKSS